MALAKDDKRTVEGSYRAINDALNSRLNTDEEIFAEILRAVARVASAADARTLRLIAVHLED